MAFEIKPLFAALSPEKQMEALQPPSLSDTAQLHVTLPTSAGQNQSLVIPIQKRRFILSTNVAETSVTVQGVR